MTTVTDDDLPPHPADDPAEIARHSDRRPSHLGTWEDPVPLVGQVNAQLPRFPLGTLPRWMSAMARAVAKFHDTPEDVPAIASLGVISTATARRARITVKGWQREEVNGYFLAALDSGHRKSGPFGIMARRPILDAQHELQADEDARAEAEDRELRQIRLSTTNATPAALRDLATANGQRLAIISSEGGVFEELAGRYDRIPDLDLVLAGYNGESYHADRATRPVPPMDRVVLTICLTAQPAVLKDMAAKPSFRDRGLLARFLYALPRDIVGKRKNDRPQIAAGIAEAYWAGMRSLLTGLYASEGIEWSLSGDAFDLFHAAEMTLEPKLARGAEYGGNDGMREWASKYMGQVLKLSGLLHAAEHADREPFDPPGVISETTMQNALTLGQYFLDHAEAAFGLMRMDPLVSDADAVLDWLRRIDWAPGADASKQGKAIAGHPGIVTRREIQTGVWAIQSADHAAEVMRLLEKCGYCRITESERRDSVRYLLHPSLFAAPDQKTSALSAVGDSEGIRAGQPANTTAEARLCTSSAVLCSCPVDASTAESAEECRGGGLCGSTSSLPADMTSEQATAETAEVFQEEEAVDPPPESPVNLPKAAQQLPNVTQGNGWPSSETGPCTECGQPCHRYGPAASSLCDDCRAR